LLTGVEETAVWTTGRIVAIRDLLTRRGALSIQAAQSRSIQGAHRSHLYASPIADPISGGVWNREAADGFRVSQELEKSALSPERQGREMLYKHPALLEVLAENA
jgi:hypothetical protein